MEHSKCLVCNSSSLNPLHDYQKHYLTKCSKCGFVFCSKIPTQEELNNYYKVYAYNGELNISPLTIKSYHILLDEFEKYRKTNKLIDVGCGAGYFLEEAKKRGWEVYGTEYSDKAVEVCLKKGINIKKGKLNASEFDGAEFDVITSFEVLEHINNPNEEIQEFKKLLRKGGLFYCTTPNFNSLMRYYLKSKYNAIKYPEHLSYYTKNTLKLLLTNNGFKPLKFLSTGISIDRFNQSKENNIEKKKVKGTSDESLRVNISKKWYLALAKNLVNYLLTITSTGLTLKGYFIKH
jgi:2-polyprenyl-3-methyl-5-hydroxy-6-metoxy-1,4-benzoquinol methylase